jgi:hypothetical protein
MDMEIRDIAMRLGPSPSRRFSRGRFSPTDEGERRNRRGPVVIVAILISQLYLADGPRLFVEGTAR